MIGGNIETRSIKHKGPRTTTLFVVVTYASNDLKGFGKLVARLGIETIGFDIDVAILLIATGAEKVSHWCATKLWGQQRADIGEGHQNLAVEFFFKVHGAC